MSRIQPLRSAIRAAPPTGARLARPIPIIHARTMAVTPDPTKPTTDPKAPVQKSSTGLLLGLIGGTALAIGGWYYMQDSGLQQERFKKDQERMDQKARELREAGLETARDVVKEGEQTYSGIKASGQEKLQHARDQAVATTEKITSKVVSSVQETRDSAAQVVQQAAHGIEQTKQSWGQWVGSWFGYGKNKAEEAKKEGAEKAAEGAQKVESEASKRT